MLFELEDGSDNNRGQHFSEGCCVGDENSLGGTFPDGGARYNCNEERKVQRAAGNRIYLHGESRDINKKMFSWLSDLPSDEGSYSTWRPHDFTRPPYSLLKNR